MMSRTANRYLINEVSEEAESVIAWQVGNYVRLSQDSEYKRSDSINNQILLGKEFVNKCEDMKLVEIYVDDGFSGTNFEKRDSFKQMIRDIHSGKINCVLVKDLSRFGRNYLEAGNFIEKVFPFLGVRFISINDNYDSADPYCNKEALVMTLKNLMHETYSMDLSLKAAKVYEQKQAKKEFYRSSTIPYGLRMGPNNRYIENTMTSHIVKDMFLWCENGITCYSIAVKLTDMGVCTPSEYNKTGKTYRGEERIIPWYDSTVKRILTNPIYIGNAVRGKTEQRKYCDLNRTVPADERIVIGEAGQSLITYEQFYHVQHILKQRTEEKNLLKTETSSPISQYNDVPIFEGTLFCGDCGSKMGRVVMPFYKEGERHYKRGYVCSAHRKYKNVCNLKPIDECLLANMVIDSVKKQIILLKDFKKSIGHNSKISFAEKLKKLNSEKSRFINASVQAKDTYMKMHEKFVMGDIEREEFFNARRLYLQSQKYTEKEKSTIERQIKKIHKAEASLRRLVLQWLKYDINETLRLDKEIVTIFVKRIDIYSNNRIEITWRYTDEFEEILAYVKEETP